MLSIGTILALAQVAGLILADGVKIVDAIRANNGQATPEHQAQIVANQAAHAAVLSAITGILQAHASGAPA